MSDISQQELDEFRAEVSAWMKDNKPADPGFLLPQTFMEVGSEQQLEFLREWQNKMWSAGYLGMAWPKEYGGRGVAPVFQRIADQEMKRNAVPIAFNVIGLGWAGPLIIDIGSEAEKKKYLKGILSAEDIWCQGFSEPDHGSDLGSAQCRAVRDGDEYVINGTKIWTTL
ncbi:MAG: acyl-CoA dehydrogenase family protein, partial [Lysobacterales bacterium]